MLAVQEFLKDKTFADLAKEHGVYASFNKAGTHFSLNYDQIESREDDSLAQECRGLILSTGKSLRSQSAVAWVKPTDGSSFIKPNYDNVCPGETTIAAFPLKRFFNYGQGACAPVNWDDPKLKIAEKLDGTLCILWFCSTIDSWQVATRSCPEADIPLDNGLFTFRTLFEKALFETTNSTFVQFTARLDKGITYCFELTTPYNRIVVKQDDCRVTLLAARDLITLKELDITALDVQNVPHVHTHDLKNISDILVYVSERNPLEHEGVVAIDSNFNRVKIKNINYVLLGRTRDTLVNDRAFLNLVLNNKEDDVMEVLPEEFQKRVLQLKQSLKDFNYKVMGQYEETTKQLSNRSPKKEFALIVQKEGFWGAPMFKMWDGKCSSFKDFLDQNRGEGGEYGHSFLDKLLSYLK